MPTNKDKNSKEAYSIISSVQVEGIKLGVKYDDLFSKNFGPHINEGIKALTKTKKYTKEEALKLLRGLNATQTKGIVDFNLPRNVVTAENFGENYLQKLYNESRKRRRNDGFTHISTEQNNKRTKGTVDDFLTNDSFKIPTNFNLKLPLAKSQREKEKSKKLGASKRN